MKAVVFLKPRKPSEAGEVSERARKISGVRCIFTAGYSREPADEGLVMALLSGHESEVNMTYAVLQGLPHLRSCTLYPLIDALKRTSQQHAESSVGIYQRVF